MDRLMDGKRNASLVVFLSIHRERLLAHTWSTLVRTLAHRGMGLLAPAGAVILKAEICAENQCDHKTKLNNIAHQNTSEAERRSPCHRAAFARGTPTNAGCKFQLLAKWGRKQAAGTETHNVLPKPSAHQGDSGGEEDPIRDEETRKHHQETNLSVSPGCYYYLGPQV